MASARVLLAIVVVTMLSSGVACSPTDEQSSESDGREQRSAAGSSVAPGTTSAARPAPFAIVRRGDGDSAELVLVRFGDAVVDGSTIGHGRLRPFIIEHPGLVPSWQSTAVAANGHLLTLIERGGNATPSDVDLDTGQVDTAGDSGSINTPTFIDGLVVNLDAIGDRCSSVRFWEAGERVQRLDLDSAWACYLNEAGLVVAAEYPERYYQYRPEQDNDLVSVEVEVFDNTGTEVFAGRSKTRYYPVVPYIPGSAPGGIAALDEWSVTVDLLGGTDSERLGGWPVSRDNTDWEGKGVVLADRCSNELVIATISDAGAVSTVRVGAGLADNRVAMSGSGDQVVVADDGGLLSIALDGTSQRIAEHPGGLEFERVPGAAELVAFAQSPDATDIWYGEPSSTLEHWSLSLTEPIRSIDVATGVGKILVTTEHELHTIEIGVEQVPSRSGTEQLSLHDVSESGEVLYETRTETTEKLWLDAGDGPVELAEEPNITRAMFLDDETVVVEADDGPPRGELLEPAGVGARVMTVPIDGSEEPSVIYEDTGLEYVGIDPTPVAHVHDTSIVEDDDPIWWPSYFDLRCTTAGTTIP